MIKTERDKIINEVKEMRELTFQLSNMLVHANQGRTRPEYLKIAKEIAAALRDKSLTVVNRLSNETSL